MYDLGHFALCQLLSRFPQASAKEKQFLNRATKYIDEIKPDYYFPFAGTYTLTGKLSNLQNLRGVASIDIANDFFENYYLSKNYKRKV